MSGELARECPHCVAKTGGRSIGALCGCVWLSGVRPASFEKCREGHGAAWQWAVWYEQTHVSVYVPACPGRVQRLPRLRHHSRYVSTGAAQPTLSSQQPAA